MRRLRLPHMFHRWRYRNPYSRTCGVCGRSEDLHSTAFGLRWEEMMTARRESGDA